MIPHECHGSKREMRIKQTSGRANKRSGSSHLPDACSRFHRHRRLLRRRPVTTCLKPSRSETLLQPRGRRQVTWTAVEHSAGVRQREIVAGSSAQGLQAHSSRCVCSVSPSLSRRGGVVWAVTDVPLVVVSSEVQPVCRRATVWQ